MVAHNILEIFKTLADNMNYTEENDLLRYTLDVISNIVSHPN